MGNALQTTTDKITIEQFQRVMPKAIKSKVTAIMVQNINGLLNDQQLRENYRDNLLSYTHVMQDGKFKIESYIAAVRYVSFKLMGASNIEAYTKTFPDRFQRLIGEGADDKTISSYVTAYNKTILVNKIMEQTLVPMHVLNADMYQKALNTQANLMTTANSEKVRSDAANSILTHLKAPEVTKMELDVNVKQDKTVDDLRATTLKLVEQQKAMLEKGSTTVRDVAHSTLINTQEEAEDAEIVGVA